MFSSCPAWVELPAGARIRKKEKSKIRGKGGVICAPRAQHGRIPKI